ncbi:MULTISPECIES: IclR family transcriptional regulator [Rhizobium]|uniref:IclR family transcriptional regulator n=1 Tax=Rhizobium tumorigenes TaxID=2041385 RepID=A0AAF1KQ01_9HYPH|nr:MULTISPECIES: IclR family transcriptional regulator [Rhizobium]QXZ93619.1 IclR family transcriptional regulator [Rhizobium sp. K15/93]QYA05114.1 IclR family transcriptional regulator [Rhizobium sp. B21/90]MBO9102295.1 IclR family transcriptional regulator [Rhizobium sp. L58/93]MBO9172363.1 IclR family transcriptional regulator [Rhizobium sp. L245/93]MBO9188112.1 IclR family transcriptional regulator [Rhizobium sp. E27B/91]
MENHEPSQSSLGKAVLLLKAISGSGAGGARLKDIARGIDTSLPTVHRLLKTLISEGLVVQSDKNYRLSYEFFCMAAKSRQMNSISGAARPSLLRVFGILKEAVILIERSKFDAICTDCFWGSHPIRTFYGGVGGRVPLGVGQGALAILAFQPDEEREQIIRFNMPRITAEYPIDELDLRTMINEIREIRAATIDFNINDGISAIAVPIFDMAGIALASLSVAAPLGRLSGSRQKTVIDLLAKEARLISEALNPLGQIEEPVAWGEAASKLV